MVAGGIDGSSTVGTAQLYNPATGTWTAAGNLERGSPRSHGDTAR